MSNNKSLKTKFIRWIIAVLFLWTLSEVGVPQLSPHIPWLVGLTWVWAAMMPLLNESTVDNQRFIRLMLTYLTSGLMVALVIPLFLTIGDDWQTAMVFYAGVMSVSGAAFLVYRYGEFWGDAGPAVGALLLTGLAMYLVNKYTLIDSLPLELLIVFLLTVSATFGLFLLVSILSYQNNGTSTKVFGLELASQDNGDDFQPILNADDSESDDSEKPQFSIDIFPPGRIVGNVGGLMALVLEIAILLTLLGVVR